MAPSFASAYGPYDYGSGTDRTTERGSKELGGCGCLAVGCGIATKFDLSPITFLRQSLQITASDLMWLIEQTAVELGQN